MNLFFLLLLSLFLILLFLVTLAPVRININYLRENKKEKLVVNAILFWGLLSFKMPLLKGRKQNGKGKGVNKETFSKNNIKNALLLWKCMRKTVICSKFRWKTAFGMSDAAQTGMLSGMIWSIKGNILAFLKRYFIFHDQKPEIEVHPDFKRAQLYVEIHGDFMFYPYRLLKAVFRMVYLKVRGGGSKWKIIQFRV